LKFRSKILSPSLYILTTKAAGSTEKLSSFVPYAMPLQHRGQ